MTSCDKDQLDELLKKGQAVTATLNRIDDINQMDGLIKKGQTDAAKLSQDYCRTELDELLKQGQTIIQNLSHDGPKVRLDEVLNQSRELIEQLNQNDHMVHPVSAQKNSRKSTYKVRSRKRDKPIFVNKSRQIPKPSISTHHARLLPMALPVSICQCGEKKYSVGKGRSITVINMKVFLSFEDLKMAAPGLSRLAFIRMLDMKTAHYGRSGNLCGDAFYKSFLEWSICRYEVDKICGTQHFKCTACTPLMLPVAVDGNRKLHRFKKAGNSKESGYFDGVFLCKDEDVSLFVDDIRKKVPHLLKSLQERAAVD
ncbi:uncharacterized protein LOC130428680 isoform X2 [Triplophysa dalaica]|uniref:uncharacterized protein LOC130428680 isoform X2 n=1 Tax=Triplophysa dalaica TaxID=1582913 RepID=UPI0024DFFC5F|nr:uncharacterized protein LOC130428680 isoform X2 [Triplophysa dalaica]